MERWSNDVVNKKTLKNNMQKFLLWSMSNDENPTVSRYDEWLEKNNLKGKSGVIYKQFKSFTSLRDKIADKINYNYNTKRDYTTDEMIVALNKCLSVKGNLKYTVYRNWAKENGYPSPHPIIQRLELNWKEIRLKFGKLNKIKTWNKKNCKEKLLKYPEVENMTIKEYDRFTKNKNLPSRGTVKRKFNGWLKMKKEVFGWKSTFSRTTISKFCRDCVYTKNCEYNYSLKKCKWYEEG